tara:strand:- start:385 stop:600 length:216 start_codon:yes stop_codon:yes gene_type:complete
MLLIIHQAWLFYFNGFPLANLYILFISHINSNLWHCHDLTSAGIKPPNTVSNKQSINKNMTLASTKNKDSF